MFNSETSLPMDSSVAAVALTDADLDQAAGGILFVPILAGIAVGAVVGAAVLVGVVAGVDYISHHTGNGCLLK